MSRRALRVIVGGAAAAASVVAAGAQTPAPAHVAVRPAEVVWGEPPPVLEPGAKFAVISGNPGESGPFVVRLRMPAGYRVAPHWHPTDEHVTVVSGTWAAGMGETFDRAALKSLPAGSYVMMPAQMRHFAIAESEVVIQVHGQGPFVINYVNPADDPRQHGGEKSTR